MPVVAIADAVPTLPSVVADDAGGSRLIARYLAGKGHRRVLYRKSAHDEMSGLRRLEAFRAESAVLGITVVDTIAVSWSDGLGERERAWLLSAESERPTAIVCWNDTIAHNTVHACLDIGLHVPHNIAVVGFDGHAWPVRLAHRLTTVRAAWTDIARKAVELLAAGLNGEGMPRETVMPVELVIGDTA
jgi:DNA-binding LacI/PurR family transcriptional regulator